MQKVSEYMLIIFNAKLNKFGTYLPMGKKFTEQLKFSFVDEKITDDERKRLAKIAAKRVSDKEDLPEGIYLSDVTIVLGGGEI